MPAGFSRYDVWLTTPPDDEDYEVLRYVNRNGREVCVCDAYDFPHRPNSGRCSTCNGCDQPQHNCICPCATCGHYPCRCQI